MAPYLDPIKMALITFPILAMILTVPFALYNYKKYGYLNKWRSFILFSFLLFIISAYYLVIMPLPETRDIKSLQSPDVKHWNLKPFQFVRDIVKETSVDIRNPKTYINILKERAFLQALFNVFLLFPLGVYLRYYFNRSLKQTVLITLGLSLFFELTQLTGLYGIYNAPYRIFDVDDLFLNTFGGVIGYLITPIFAFFLPDPKELDERAGSKRYKLGFIRRFIAFYIIDLGFINILSNLFKFNEIYKGLFFIGYFTIVPLLTNGRTLGYFLTNLRLFGKKDKLRFRETFLRSLSFYIVFFGINILLDRINKMNMSGMYGDYLIFLHLFIFAFNMLIFINCLYSIVKGQKLFYERISKTYLKVDKIKENKS